MNEAAKKYLAIDIGASSGRHIFGKIVDGKMVLQEVYRFENKMEEREGHSCWNYDELFNHILKGMKACAEVGGVPDFMGIDTWGVDFVFLDNEDKLVGDTVAYRDSRTEGMDVEVEKVLSFEDLYQRTGIQKQPFNTIYQLMALKLEHPEHFDIAENMLFVPDYFNYLLTGVKNQEYTFASTSGLLNAKAKDWDYDLIKMLGFNEKLFKKLSMPGNAVGRLSAEIQDAVGFDCTVVQTASHDTASAYLAVPAPDDFSVYISSGTWSLLGFETLEPIITNEARKGNFTNEGGYNYRYRFLRNIMGLWMIQSVRRENLKEDGERYSFAVLEDMAKESAYFESVVDVNDNVFFAPENMTQAVKDFCKNSGQKVPETLGEIMQCVYISLAKCYADSVKRLEEITGKTYTGINIVGGGSKDTYLNTLTGKAANLPVMAGPTEGTVIGNLIVQMLHSKDVENLAAARDMVRKSFEVKSTGGN